MTELTAHPVADLFPMLAADELADLAADIKQRGLLQPIVLDPQGRVLDGRNRLAACEKAGVEPTFETYEGNDPDGYALAVNIARRHLRPSQRYILIEQARRLTNVRKSALISTDGEARGLSEAAVVLDYAPDLAEAVLGNNLALHRAAEMARDRKRDAAELKAKNERLREAAPDLADQVHDGRLDLDEALGALDVREQRARQEAEAARREAEARASEQERQRRMAEQERQESLERDRERIRMVVTGWSTVRDLILPDPDGDRAAEILAGLGENDRLAIKRIVAELTE